MPRDPRFLVLLSVLALGGPALAAPRTPDEGMWTFDRPPTGLLEERYGFEPTQEWLDHVRLSSVRINDGGSGSFVSPRGLVLTNHHVGFEAIQELSSAERDLVVEGFEASSHEEELAVPDMEINVLVSLEDVTERVRSAVREGATEKEAREDREAEIARIEKESSERTGRRADVVELYAGGRYVLHLFRKYTDVRLVFAPEQQAAYFGGDPDNFNYPRYCLDMALFRVWEDGEPAETPHWLEWNEEGAAEGELVFVSGNPGSTGRLDTVAQLTYLRDVLYPLYLENLRFRREVLREYSARGEEQARRAKDQLFSVENSIKALGGYLESLTDGRSMEIKRRDEDELRRRVAADPELAAEVGDAWEAIARAQEEARRITPAWLSATIRGSRLFGIARHVVRLASELEKPNEERLPAYRESALPSLELTLYSEAPIYPDLEEEMIAAGLEFMRSQLGDDHPLVRAALEGPDAIEASASGAAESKLLDPAHRRSLVEGGPAAVAASDDPIVQLALRIDPLARELREKREERVESVEERHGARIARARFEVWGTDVYPDATFTPRLSFGTVRGYALDGGYPVPWRTTFYGLYERSHAFGGEPPYDLAPSFAEPPEGLDLATPFDFVCTADIIGGNSGSPVIDREGTLVGLIFDGNVQSLGNRFVYDETVARAVSVHAGAMLAALRSVYGAEAVVEEILAARR